MHGILGITVITAFMIVSMGYNPFGCKTQFLFNTPKYWYNKQISLLLLIYFAIVMGGKGTLLITPIATIPDYHRHLDGDQHSPDFGGTVGHKAPHMVVARTSRLVWRCNPANDNTIHHPRHKGTL